jgi:hypothetical protein
LALLLFAAAVYMLVRGFYGGGQSAAAAPAAANIQAPVLTTPAPRNRRLRGRVSPNPPSPGAAAAPLVSLDPRLRLDLLKVSEDTEYKGAGRNIFRAEAEPVIEKPIENPVKKQEDAKKAPEPPPGPPPPPPINLKFFGFVSGPGQPKKIFLAQGDDVFIAREGEIVGRRYKVVHISNTSVDIEDVLSNNRQTIPLTQG